MELPSTMLESMRATEMGGVEREEYDEHEYLY